MMMWECTAEGQWIATRLPEREAFALDAGVSVIRWKGGRECGLLVRGDADADVEINGGPALSLQVLAHRDEIRVAGRLFYFSVASPPEPAHFAPGKHEVHCARCKVPLSANDRVLHCPLCRGPHHLECFNYVPTCGACRETMSWMPEGVSSGINVGSSGAARSGSGRFFSVIGSI